MPYDVAHVRSLFPALKLGVAHFDGPGGSQVPQPVAEAIAATMTSGIANRGRRTEAERRADDTVHAARQAVADLLSTDPRGVVFGRSMTQLTYDLARTTSRRWGPGDEVVVTRLDHDANVRPWVQAAEWAGATVRWAEPELPSMELPVEAVARVLSSRTRLVAVTGASNLVGTRPDVRAVADEVHRAGALLHVDAVHLVPHAPVDRAELGADLLTFSPYKCFGPHLGVLTADPALLETLHPDKLLPSSDAVPERFELGTLPYESLAGVTAAVEVIADLAPAVGDRRQRVRSAMGEVQAYEDRLFARLLDGLARAGAVRHGTPAHHTPTVLFEVPGVPSATVSDRLAAEGVNAPHGSFYALEASRRLGLGDTGAVRAGLAPYTDDGDVDRLVDGVTALAR